MDKIEEFEFLENYYNLLKNKSTLNIGNRYIEQIKRLSFDHEISTETLNIISACISIGVYLKDDLDPETMKTIKNFINIGSEMKEERDAFKVATALSDASDYFSAGNGVRKTAKGTSKGYSGTYSSGGC